MDDQLTEFEQLQDELESEKENHDKTQRDLNSSEEKVSSLQAQL